MRRDELTQGSQVMQPETERSQPERHGRGAEPSKAAAPDAVPARDRAALRRFRMQQIEDAWWRAR